MKHSEKAYAGYLRRDPRGREGYDYGVLGYIQCWQVMQRRRASSPGVWRSAVDRLEEVGLSSGGFHGNR